MTKSKQSLVPDPAQMSLFDSIKQDQAERIEKKPGRMCVTHRLHAAYKAAIKGASKSREQIADDMSELSCRKVTVSMINNWLADSHPHEMTCDLIDAFCEATGDNRPLLVLTDTYGIHTIEAPDKIRARLQKLEEQKKELDKEKHRYASLLHELERKP